MRLYLPNGEIISIIGLSVMTQYRNVRNGRLDRNASIESIGCSVYSTHRAGKHQWAGKRGV